MPIYFVVLTGYVSKQTIKYLVVKINMHSLASLEYIGVTKWI